MDKATDLLIGKLLKNWTGRHRPPVDVRARLLWDAAHQKQAPARRIAPRSSFLLFSPQVDRPTDQYAENWSQALFQWASDHSLQAGMPTRLT
jgi:hypothetical protein